MSQLVLKNKTVIFYCIADRYRVFEEYIESIRHHISSCRIILYTDKSPDISDNCINIFVQSAPPDITSSNFYIINTEQMTRPGINTRINNSKNRYIDYSLENIALYNKALYLPYQINYNEIYNYKKTKGVATVCVNYSDNRKKIYNKLIKKRIPITNILGWGKNRDNILFRHKILLNIHFNENYNIFETIRCFRCLLNKMIIISEDSNNKDLIEYKEHIIFCKYDRLVDTTIQVYNNYEYYYNKLFKKFDVKKIEKEMFDHLQHTLSILNTMGQNNTD